MQINGLTNGYRSAAAYREAAKWGETPEIQKKAQATAENAMTDGFVKRIKELAKQDAKKGDYMGSEFTQLRLSHMAQYVSPDRSGPIADATNLIQAAMKDYDPLLSLLDTMLGNCSMEARISPEGQTAHIYSSDGEMIASYNSLGGGWKNIPTKAETKFMGEAASVYAQAFKEARAELAAAGGQAQVNASVSFTEGSFSVKV